MDRDGSGAHRLRESVLSGWSIDNPSFSPSGRFLTFVGEHHGKGNVIIGRTPSALFTIRRDGSRLRIAQTEKARIFSRDPAWVRWQREGGG
jgi:Tol biopolymer transport system component